MKNESYHSGGFLFTRKFRWNHLLYLIPFVSCSIFLRKFSLIREVLRDQRLAEPRFRDMSGTVAFRGVLPQQDLFDPGVHRESTDMVKAEETDAVGNLDADSVAGEENFHGVSVIQFHQAVKFQLTGTDLLAGPLDLFCAVAKLYGTKVIQRGTV